MKKRTHRRKRTHKTALSGHRTPTRRRSRRRGMSAGFSKASLMENGKEIALGLAGGAIATQANKMIQGFKVGTIGKLLIGAGVGLVGASFGFKSLGVGFAGGIASLNFDVMNLKEGEDLEDEMPLEDMPVYQTESGEFVKMLNDGSLEPLSDEEINALSENEIYPAYGTMNSFQI